MADNCKSCQDLIKDASEFVENGVTTSVCNSLKNNTGLNPSLTTLHTDETDLNKINDCYIDNTIKGVDGYNNCNLKDFIKVFGSKLYQYNRAMICALSGIWAKIDAIMKKLTAIKNNIITIITKTNAIMGSIPKPTDEKLTRVYWGNGLTNGAENPGTSSDSPHITFYGNTYRIYVRAEFLASKLTKQGDIRPFWGKGFTSAGVFRQAWSSSEMSGGFHVGGTYGGVVAWVIISKQWLEDNNISFIWNTQVFSESREMIKGYANFYDAKHKYASEMSSDGFPNELGTGRTKKITAWDSGATLFDYSTEEAQNKYIVGRISLQTVINWEDVKIRQTEGGVIKERGTRVALVGIGQLRGKAPAEPLEPISPNPPYPF